MLDLSPKSLLRILTLLAGFLVLKVTGIIVLKYRDYLPPNFDSDFLHGRESYFYGSYQWAFYIHLAAGPVVLVVGMILVSDRFRRRFPNWHRYLGRIQAALVLFLIAPSGLWMARHAEAGPMAAVGFALLAVVTATSVALGLRAAMQRRFADHRCWMWRCYLMLCSTVVLRLLAGLATVTHLPGNWLDPATAWVSWLGPLAVYELYRRYS